VEFHESYTASTYTNTEYHENHALEKGIVWVRAQLKNIQSRAFAEGASGECQGLFDLYLGEMAKALLTLPLPSLPLLVVGR